MTLGELNIADESTFVDVVGPLFEDSAWIAHRAARERPYVDADALFERLIAIVRESPREAQLGLICAHPDLAGRLAREGRLTAASRDEQASAGLDLLTCEERERFALLNDAYRKKFGFPFVICAREHDKASILAAMTAREKNPPDTELSTALGEIEKIARLRWRDVLSSRA